MFKNWRNLWDSIKECYEDMIFEVLETMYLLRLDKYDCERIGNYKGFLFELSLWPLTLNRLANPDNYWLKYSQTMTKNSYNMTKVLSTEEKHHMNYQFSSVSRYSQFCTL